VDASGTVLNAFNPVLCTLCPISLADGTLLD
jgi:hypothetical protein